VDLDEAVPRKCKILVKMLAGIYHLIDLEGKKCDIKPSYGFRENTYSFLWQCNTDKVTFEMQC
jgi:hypothetical protein